MGNVHFKKSGKCILVWPNALCIFATRMILWHLHLTTLNLLYFTGLIYLNYGCFYKQTKVLRKNTIDWLLPLINSFLIVACTSMITQGVGDFCLQLELLKNTYDKKKVHTSVVMTRALALGFIVTSPVIRPTSWNSSYNSLYFWLLRAFKKNVANRL